jgi:hypothetical protein
MRFRFARRAVLIAALICAAAMPEWSTWVTARRVGVADLNGDGRSDVWRTYDRNGDVVEVAIDSNFDGRSDVHEFYAGGQLVRRESDRNFDDRVDLVEEFDGSNVERSVSDTDFDGRADLLTLFQGGRAIFSKLAPQWLRHGAVPVAASARRGDAPLSRFLDPFNTDLSVRHPRDASHQDGSWTAESSFTLDTPIDTVACFTSTAVWSAIQPLRIDSRPEVRSPRGPPASSLT